VVFAEELFTKRIKMGLFKILKQDIGLAKMFRESHLFAQKREAYMNEILRNVNSVMSALFFTAKKGLLQHCMVG